MHSPEANHTERDAVSVVIPCYNQAGFLPDAIHSAINQNGVAVRVIVVDDGSTDHTAEVAAWDGWNGRVELVRQENRGLPAARNAGLACVQTEFVIFLDADDKLLPDAAIVGRRILVDEPGAVAAAGLHKEFSESTGAEEPRPIDQSDGVADHVTTSLDAYLHELRSCATNDVFVGLLQGNFIGMPGAVIYRTQGVREERGFDVTLGACEDYDLYLRIARKGTLRLHDGVVGLYRKHPESMSRDPARMLKWSVRVLRRQSAQLDKVQREALHHGVLFWSRYYGTRLRDKILRNAGNPTMRLRAKVRDRWILFRYADREWRNTEMKDPVRLE